MTDVKCYPVDPSYLDKQDNSGAKCHIPTDDVNKLDIVKATQYGVTQRCIQLVEEGFDVNQMDPENVSLLHWAAINDRKELVQYYHSKGANVNIIGGDLRCPPIHWAVRQGLLDMVALLLRLGADPSIKDIQGLACIHVAVQLSRTDIVAYFLAYGISPDTLDFNGMTPLMWASSKNTGPDPVRLLVNWGCNVNIQDRNGCTAGHYAAMIGNFSAVMLLNEGKIDWNIVNDDGVTVYQLLMKRNIPMLADRINNMLIERGIKRHRNFFVNSTVKNRSFRLITMMTVPPIVFLMIGLIFHVSLSYLVKLLMIALIFVGLKFGLARIVDSRVNIVTLFSLATSTTFYLCATYIYLLVQFNSFITNIVFCISISLVWYNFIKCCRMDPGFIRTKPEERNEVLMALAHTDPSKRVAFHRFCTTCLILKPLRSKHCSVCDRCVAKFDHHCPWIYNCVGVNNHAPFMMYLLGLIPSLSLFAYGCISFWSTLHISKSTDSVGLGFYKFFTEALTNNPWIFYCFINSIIYLFWVSLITISQIYQVFWLNETTNERINWDRYSTIPMGNSTNSYSPKGGPYNMGFIRNLQDFFQSKSFKIDWFNTYTIDTFHRQLSCRSKYENV